MAGRRQRSGLQLLWSSVGYFWDAGRDGGLVALPDDYSYYRADLRGVK